MYKDVAYTNTVAPEKGQTTFHQRGCPKAVVGASHNPHHRLADMPSAVTCSVNLTVAPLPFMYYLEDRR
jgi:hypothetical protein